LSPGRDGLEGFVEGALQRGGVDVLLEVAVARRCFLEVGEDALRLDFELLFEVLEGLLEVLGVVVVLADDVQVDRLPALPAAT